LKDPANSEELTRILASHVLLQVYPSEFLVNGSQVITLGGLPIDIITTDGSIMLNGATVVLADVLANNGIAHAIDALLTGSGASAPGTVNVVLESDTEFSILDAALALVGLNDTFEAHATVYTVFAPVDSAFENLDQDFWSKLQTPSWSVHLQNLLDMHVVDGGVLSAVDLTEGMAITMRNGETVTVNVDQNGIALTSPSTNGSLVTESDLVAAFGVVHKIDSVLLPSFYEKDLLALKGTLAGFDILFDLIDRADISRNIGSVDVTVLAPNDDAFVALGSSTLKRLIDPDNLAELQQLLASHVLTTVYPLSLFEDGTTLKSLGGLAINVTVTEDKVQFNEATVVNANVLALNGIVHTIDRVLGISPLSTIEETLIREADLSMFSSAYFSADLNGSLNDTSGFTVFAPVDSAFAAIDEAYLTRLLSPNWVLHLQNMLNFHITETDYLLQDLVDGLEISMRNGERIVVKSNATDLYVFSPNTNVSMVVEADLVVFNGVVQKMDAVLLPSFFSQDALSLRESNDRFTIFFDLIALAKLESTLRQGVLTLLIPTNQAFLAVGNETMDFLMDPKNNLELENVLAQHILDEVYPSVLLKDGDVLTTIGNLEIDVVRANGAVKLNDATVELADFLFNNGIAHAIDRVITLDPNIPSPAPRESSPASAASHQTSARFLWLTVLGVLLVAVGQ
jgi:transforming growth factor-beta-induced protein